MLSLVRDRACPRCGGAVYLEPGTGHGEARLVFVTCLMCGELLDVFAPPGGWRSAAGAARARSDRCCG